MLNWLFVTYGKFQKSASPEKRSCYTKLRATKKNDFLPVV